MNRRSFLQFLGQGALGLAIHPTLLAAASTIDPPLVRGIAPCAEDDLRLAAGFSYDILIRWNDSISDRHRFGFNNDFTAFLPDDPLHPNRGTLWVNHEYLDTRFVSPNGASTNKSIQQIRREMYQVGGSILRVEKDETGNWQVDREAPENRRLHALTEIPFAWPEPIHGSRVAIGTLANCSGGITPWGTILTCEENYDMFWGERHPETGEVKYKKKNLGWQDHYDHPPEHYGWVVEVNLQTGEARKLVALGRCAHECATVHELADGRVVVYTGDDANDECLYKFVSSKPGSLTEGTLYVANTIAGRWESLDYETQAVLQENFRDQTDVLIHLRRASKLVGGTPLDRPEDIEIDPLTGAVLVSLTNNKPKGNHHGAILKIEEGESYAGLTFRPSIFLAGGEETGFSCPDNMAFDGAGNLWFTSDISGRAMHKAPYTVFKNNGLFVVPRRGPQAGQVIQIASAPNDAEFTGPSFAPDGKTLFLSVQHPGETSTSIKELSSNWPEGGGALPRSAVVTIRGEGLEALQAL